MSEAIEGFFLTFNDKERKMVFDALEEEDFPLDSAGLKQALLDWAEPQPEPKVKQDLYGELLTPENVGKAVRFISGVVKQRKSRG